MLLFKSRTAVSAVVLLCLAVTSIVLATQDTCSDPTQDCSGGTGTENYVSDFETNLLATIKKAQEEYTDCSNKNVGCYKSVIEADLAPWKDGIKREIFDELKTNRIHYQVINHKLYRSQKCNFPARCEGIEHFLLKVIKELPDTEFVINVSDPPNIHRRWKHMPLFSFSKTPDYVDIMYPAWTFWAGGPAVWPIEPTGLGRWDVKRDAIANKAKEFPWEKKKNVGFFRGSRTSDERDPLILLSRAEPNLADAAYVKNQAFKSVERDLLGGPEGQMVKLEDHCPYKYQFNFRGVAASFRHKHLFLCNSLVFHVGEEWLEFYYPAMKPWVHYVPVSVKMTEVKQLLEFFQKHDDVAKQIADRGYQFIWDHLRMEDIFAYWKTLLREYTKLLTWDVVRDKSLIAITATTNKD